jgi:excinuclease ABC subunit A
LIFWFIFGGLAVGAFAEKETGPCILFFSLTGCQDLFRMKKHGKPIKNIKPKALNFILYGTENVEELEDGFYEYKEGDYEGIVNNLKRCYNETSSENLRSWAEEFMEIVDCPECKGARLKNESLQFKVADETIAAVASWDLSKLAEWFSDIENKLDNKQNTIAKELLK